jgi:hypothetical protein
MISHRAITALVGAGLALCGLAFSAAAQSVTRPTIEAPTIARPEAPKAPNLEQIPIILVHSLQL